MRSLDLEPCRPARAGRVRCIERLGHQALVPSRQYIVVERLRLSRVVGDYARHRKMRRDEFEGNSTFAIGAVDQIYTVKMQHIEQNRRERQFVPVSTSVAAQRRIVV